MVTAIYSLDKINGAEIMLLGWVICGIIYLLFCLLMRENRSRQGLRNVLWYLLVSEIVTDVIWAILYYEDGSYVNYGLGSIYGVLIWPIILLTAGTFVTIQNREK
jgi:hypothetical protein